MAVGGRTIASSADGGEGRTRSSRTYLTPGQVVPGIGVLKKLSLIVMIRHDNEENTKVGLFTGWDVPLATDGEEAKVLKHHGFEFNAIHTSWLSRAIEMAWYVMDEMDCLWLPIIKSWRLNESEQIPILSCAISRVAAWVRCRQLTNSTRFFDGALTGLSKATVKQRHVHEGYAVKPPPVSSFSPQYPGNDVRYNKYPKDIRISVSATTKGSGRRGGGKSSPSSRSSSAAMPSPIANSTD